MTDLSLYWITVTNPETRLTPPWFVSVTPKRCQPIRLGTPVLDYVIYHSNVDRLAALENDTVLCKWYWVIKVHIVIICPMCFFDFNLPNAWHWRKWETTYYLCRHSWQNILNVQWLDWLIAWLWLNGTFSTNRLYHANCASLLCLQLLSIIF